MISLGQANVVGMTPSSVERRNPIQSWTQAACAAGLNPEELKCEWSLFTGGKVPQDAVATFFVRRSDPVWFLVKK